MVRRRTPAPSRSHSPIVPYNYANGPMTTFVTGAAGFIGSNLVDRLLAGGETVVGYDNLSTGRTRFLDAAMAHPNFHFVKGDILDPRALTEAMRGATLVFHFAANADVRFGTEHPDR